MNDKLRQGKMTTRLPVILVVFLNFLYISVCVADRAADLAKQANKSSGVSMEGTSTRTQICYDSEDKGKSKKQKKQDCIRWDGSKWIPVRKK